MLLVLLIHAESMSIEDPFSNLVVHPRILLFTKVLLPQGLQERINIKASMART